MKCRGVKDLEQNREGRMSAKDSEQGRDVKDLEQNREVPGESANVEGRVMEREEMLAGP